MVLLDSKSALKSLSEQAPRYTVVLNGRIDRDTTRRPLVGESADVYEGTLRPAGVKVAVKTIHAYPPATQEAIERVLREVHLWSNLRHENIQLLLGISTDFNFTLLGIANGLHYLHNHEFGPIVHGGLRGSNVLISDDGQALLIDFGLMSLVNSTFGLPVSVSRMAAINWTAPECLEGPKAAVEQDIWSYGMTALELFTRNPPFHDKPTVRVLMQRIMAGPPDRPNAQSTHSHLTDEWWEICMSCWNRDPSARPGIADIATRIAAKSGKK
ncbi:kinase-like domain-containing protein [Pisolithus tinctorius]|nr:kinase-like domain-containing protein [Pisolithus tinctorius]